MYDAVRASAEVAAELSYVIPLSEFEESTATARSSITILRRKASLRLRKR